MNKSGLCKCGCGGITNKAPQTERKRGYVKGEHVGYINGHVKYNGGKASHSEGYVLIRLKDHPRTDSRGYVAEHILNAEAAIGRFLTPEEVVHHKDRNPKNNAQSNLQICRDHSEHKIIHIELNAMEKCGNKDWRSCSFCKQYDDVSNLCYNKSNRNHYHRKCATKYASDLRKSKRGIECQN